MKTEEVTLWISLQFVSFPRISLAPATSDEITTLAVNRRVASSNLARGANFLSINELAAAFFSVFGDRSKNVVRVPEFSTSEPTRTAQKPNVFCENVCGKARPFGS
jgi:hypothetical protein